MTLREDEIAKGISVVIYRTFFKGIPSDMWTIEKSKENVFCIGTLSRSVPFQPYSFSFRFDTQNAIISFYSLHLRPEVRQLFPSIYCEVLHYLRMKQVDCLLHSPYETLRFNSEGVPFRPTGRSSQKIKHSLTTLAKIMGEGEFCIWDKQILFQSKWFEGTPFVLRFSNSGLDINNKLCAHTAEIYHYTFKLTQYIDKAKKLTNHFVRELAIFDKDIRYCRKHETVTFFKKNFQFSVKCVLSQNSSFSGFSITLNQENSLVQQEEQAISHIEKLKKTFIPKARLRAATEGRS